MGYLDMRGFSFDGVSTRSFGLIVGFTGTIDTDVETGLSVNLEKGDTNMVRRAPNLYGTKYQDTLKFELGLFKRDGSNLSYEESRAINRWLMGASVYKRLVFEDAQPEAIHYYAVCTSVVDYLYSGFMGKKVIFQCDAPYGYLAEKSATISKGADVKIFNLSDDGDYYPTLLFRASSGYTGTMALTNVTDGEQRAAVNFEKVSAVGGAKSVTMDCRHGRLTDGNGALIPGYKIGWTDENALYWPRLLPGENVMRLSGTGTVTVTCEFPRKVGTI